MQVVQPVANFLLCVGIDASTTNALINTGDGIGMALLALRMRQRPPLVQLAPAAAAGSAGWC